MSSSFIDMEIFALIKWIDVIYASSFVLNKLFPFSSHVWSIASAEFLRNKISSPIPFSSIVLLLILITDSVSVSVRKSMSVLNELLGWTLIQGRF